MRTRSIAVAVGLLVLSGLAAPSSARAGTAASPHGLWVAQAGPTQLTWSWSPVAGATSYRIAMSTDPTMKSPRLLTVPGRVATFERVPPGIALYAAVRAITAEGLSAPSVKVQARSAVVPQPRGEQVPGYDSVAWRWNPFVGATAYRVQQSTMASFAGNVQSHVVTGRTITLGVERDSHGYLRVKPLDATGRPIADAWSLVAKAYVAYHPV
jgi:hypothetical protein